jgi:hypothetical protein
MKLTTNLHLVKVNIKVKVFTLQQTMKAWRMSGGITHFFKPWPWMTSI